MGNIITVTGMVLSSLPVGEFDRRIVLLTKERGKISAFAKGSRRMNSPLMGVTQPFVFGEFEIYEGRTSFDIHKADISYYFTEVTGDYEAVCYACYFAEMADYYGRENLEAPKTLNLLYLTLKALKKPSIPNELVRCIYELRLININGECPGLFECGVCGGSNNLHGFSVQNFGMVCDSCRDSGSEGIGISESCAYTLQYIVSAKLEKLYTFTVSDSVLKELSHVMGRIRAKIIDRKMKSLELLESTL